MVSEVLVFIAVTLSIQMETSAQTVINKQDLNVATFNDVYCNGSSKEDKLYYRYLQPSKNDSTALYVGAMNFLYKVKTDTLTCLKHKEFTANYDDYRRCTIQGKSGIPDCQNHIRVVMEINNQLIICGTGAYAPTKYTLNSELHYTDLSSGIAICPYDPFDNYTALVVSDGNPGGATVPYFGTYTDFIKSSPVFYRPKFLGALNNVSYTEKTTDREDIAWLNYPQFVGSFDDSESVLFFFRETALEYQASRNKFYSRVGKVCKYDVGEGYNKWDVTKKKWLSFQKARVVCSLPGSSPFYFDEIYDVYESGGRFYALFFLQAADLSTSAICVYKKQDIVSAFKGKFKYRTSYGTWEAVPDNLNPNPRLDDCSAHKENPDIFKDSVSRYQLMDQNVNPVYGKPVYYRTGVQLNRIVVSKTHSNNMDSTTATNIYAASDEGEIFDIFLKEFSSDYSFVTHLNLIYRPFGNDTNSKFAVWNMKLMDNTLLLGTDYEVASIKLDDVCASRRNISECVLNINCKWKKCTHSCVTTGSDNCTNPEETKDWTMIKIGGIYESFKETGTECGSLHPPSHGTVSYLNGTVIGSVASYSCHSGYILQGPVYRTCISNATWDGFVPTCHIFDITKGPICLNCKDMSHLHLCDTIKQCAKNQVCFVEKFLTTAGQVKYNTGCLDDLNCVRSQGGIVKRSAECVSCCNTSLCNTNGCGAQGLPPRDQRGPLCYDCAYVSSMDECITITICGKEEVCAIEKHSLGGLFDQYTAKCHSKQCIYQQRSSQINQGLHRVSRSVPVCQRCCGQDLCNDACNMTSQTDSVLPIVGIISSTPKTGLGAGGRRGSPLLSPDSTSLRKKTSQSDFVIRIKSMKLKF